MSFLPHSGIDMHDSIRDALFSAVQSAALVPRKEVPSLIPGSSSCPADVYLPNWRRGQPDALDVTVTLIPTLKLQPLTLAGAATTPSHALHVGEERKMVAHADACRSVARGPLRPNCCRVSGWLDWGSHQYNQKH